MAFAYGFGHGAGFGFGLGFLNLIGTVLFFIFLVFLVKTIVRGGWRGGRGPRGGGPEWGGGWWGGPPRRWSGSDESRGDGWRADEALRTARERLAGGEISPQEFESLKRGLGSTVDGTSRHDDAVNLARLRFARGELSSEEFEAVKKALLA